MGFWLSWAHEDRLREACDMSLPIEPSPTPGWLLAGRIVLTDIAHGWARKVARNLIITGATHTELISTYSLSIATLIS